MSPRWEKEKCIRVLCTTYRKAGTQKNPPYNQLIVKKKAYSEKKSNYI